ncbi:MAG: succinate dehydrogenase, hydrophobic membrane anchor protein [Gammaproteobacteria bacterium]|jgi:succinate dehydrogenase / fumarate reductase, membrane anchor subunit|uniref:succinate dehydrogenase, hydrophobic membrane anchor protein n=1 Tax=Methyloprofundus sp. TaxID=2020875 RepID=UPI0017B83861|nr:succinate dehydrogenase, hydrophobic membrane anchor protein [Methyloprofundus sp.]MBT3811892.1 succinate dehydrogenase, hydrophobic membrane anchor protein [Gammaproteobacteria bacterium]HIL78389.1 succinate dehydrogenase, hydrophobic membrane anchor protein [Methylococcales bacterium]MBT4146818.1 succinate dehydrogenase, hydrophobic membrane anchor protein [Gammaproteobacteria bacterium]MBT5223018.1 succinate dehydrogenase, hydrophobic membrane anchor protein [Gammaproteobacteria bacterium
MEYQTPLAKARGLGSAKTGTKHWWMQRVTAVALVPLSFWLILFIDQLLHASYAEIREWLISPLNFTLLLAWAFTGFYHSALGLQVVIEDYVNPDGLKIVMVWVIKLTFTAMAIASLVFTIRIAVLAG